MAKIYETNYRKFLLQHTEESIEDMYKTGVYEIVNKINGKRYIGSAAQDQDEYMAQRGFYVRWYLHITHLQGEGVVHHCRHLQNSWNYH